MLNYAKLVSSGRARAVNQPWEAEELELLFVLIKERKVAMTIAADFIRNGIESLEEYDKAVEKKFKPLSVDEAKDKASDDLKKEVKKVIRSKRKK